MRSFLTLFIFLLLTGCAAQPPAPQTVNVIVFPGGFNWPIWVAQEKGLFAKNGLDVRLTPTPSSVFQLTNLIEGKFDIAMTAIDNLIAYREGQGEEPVLGPDLIAFMGGDNGFLRLVAVRRWFRSGALRSLAREKECFLPEFLCSEGIRSER